MSATPCPQCGHTYSEEWHALTHLSICDVSDALQRLDEPLGGFIDGISFPLDTLPSTSHDRLTKLIGPVSTMLFVSKSPTSPAPTVEKNIPSEAHWVDLAPPDTVVFIQGPEGITSALLGDIMMTRLQALGTLGAVVHGRIRDVHAVRELAIPYGTGRDPFLVFSKGKSSLGAATGAKPWVWNVPLVTPGGVNVNPGDIIFAEPYEGVVVIPRAKLGKVLDLAPRLKAADERVLHAVREGGSTVKDAFAKFRF